ncbi:MAG TPA: tetratricopeptide repeat protein [Candidatus Obscuribacterales bacterium]
MSDRRRAVILSAFLFLVLGSFVTACASLSRWQTFYSAGEKYRLAGEYKLAEKVFNDALTEATMFGGAGEQIGKTYFSLAELYRSQGRTDEAEKAVRQAIDRFVTSEDVSAEHAHALLLLADLCYSKKQLREAEGYYAKGIAMLSKFPSDKDFAMALSVSLSQHGAVLGDLRMFKEADGEFKRSLAVTKSLPIREFKLLQGKILSRYAATETGAGHFEEAERLFKQALYHEEIYWCPADPNVARVMADYENMLRKAGRTKEADHLKLRREKISASVKENPLGLDPEGKDVSKYYCPGIDGPAAVAR